MLATALRTTALTLALAAGPALAASHTTEGGDAMPADAMPADTSADASAMDGSRDLSYGERTGGALMTANLMNLDGEEIGRATFSMTPSGIVIVRAEASGLEDGEHGFHIHETGECDASGGFMSAGGHYVGQDDPSHGPGVEGGPHAGDLPNIIVTNGTFNVEHFNPRVTLDGDMNPLNDADGSAILVHSRPDDYESQPGGDAGDRVACGVISMGTAQ